MIANPRYLVMRLMHTIGRPDTRPIVSVDSRHDNLEAAMFAAKYRSQHNDAYVWIVAPGRPAHVPRSRTR